MMVVSETRARLDASFCCFEPIGAEVYTNVPTETTSPSMSLDKDEGIDNGSKFVILR